MATYEVIIGLEVHVQLDTASKMFCRCPVQDNIDPNRAICPVCVGHPGTLPVLNARAVHLGVAAALATSCTVNSRSVFARKQYFYPDLPKGYQISQFEEPLASNGTIHIRVNGENRAIGIERIHLEEDAGKSMHDSEGTTVDFNRAGTPLAEVVSKAEIRSPEEASQYLKVLHKTMVRAGICKGDLEKGHFRCDANVSVHNPGTPWGTRAEVKNLNSFRFVAKAIQYEIDRQINIIDAGGTIIQETRSWRDGHTHSMRTKEESSDYRYFPEPDLQPLVIDEAMRRRASEFLPATPMDLWLQEEDDRRLAQIQGEYGLDDYSAGVITSSADTLAFFESAVKAGGASRSMANWVQGDVLRRIKEGDDLSESQLTPHGLVQLQELVDAGQLNLAIARKLFDELWDRGAEPKRLVEERGLSVISDPDALRLQIKKVLSEHPSELEKFRGGNKRIIGFFMGQIMRATRGRADPGITNGILIEELEPYHAPEGA